MLMLKCGERRQCRDTPLAPCMGKANDTQRVLSNEGVLLVCSRMPEPPRGFDGNSSRSGNGGHRVGSEGDRCRTEEWLRHNSAHELSASLAAVDLALEGACAQGGTAATPQFDDMQPARTFASSAEATGDGRCSATCTSRALQSR